MRIYMNTFGQVYGGGPYGSSTYQNGTVTTGTSTPAPSPTPGGTLTNTGFDLILAGSVAAALIAAAIVVRVWRRPTTKSAN